jgi:hypothetical protein
MDPSAFQNETISSDTTPLPSDEDTGPACDATMLDPYLGQPWDTVKDLDLPWPKALRVVEHMSPMTMDYRSNRLTIELNADRTIGRAQCV